MDNQVQLFNVEEFGAVRFIIIGNEPWFVAVDICNALGYTNSRDALAKHVPDKFKCSITRKEWLEMVRKQTASNQDLSQQMASNQDSSESRRSFSYAILSNGAESTCLFDDQEMGGTQRLTLIREAGLWRLVLRSNLPDAARFTDKVCEEILPSIRKTGMYIADPALRKRLEHIKETEQWAQTTGLSPKLRNVYSDAAETLMKEFAERSLANDEVSKRAYELRAKHHGTDIDTPHFLRKFIAEHCEFDRFAHVPADIFIKLLREEYPTSTAGYTNRQIVKDLRYVKGVEVIRDSYSTCIFGIKFKAQNHCGLAV